MPSVSPVHAPRGRADRCPGVLRPWLAEDGALLRVRLVGGLLRREQLAGLARLAEEYGDGTVHLTTRANLQIRAVPTPVPEALVDEIAGLGLLPSAAHERARNVMVSPLTGRIGGLADLRPVARQLDTALCAEADLADLPARFLFCLDDRGDLHGRSADLAAVAVGPNCARLWAGGLAGDVVHLADVPRRLVELARDFMAERGTGPTAPWHVAELPAGGAALGPFHSPPAAATSAPPAPPPYGLLPQGDGRRLRHVPVRGGTLTPDLLEQTLSVAAGEVVVTPWRSLLLPDLEPAA